MSSTLWYCHNIINAYLQTVPILHFMCEYFCLDDCISVIPLLLMFGFLQVLVNVVGALAEMAKHNYGSQEIRKVNGLTPLVNLLKNTNPALLVNVAKAVGHCAEDPENIV